MLVAMHFAVSVNDVVLLATASKCIAANNLGAEHRFAAVWRAATSGCGFTLADSRLVKLLHNADVDAAVVSAWVFAE